MNSWMQIVAKEAAVDRHASFAWLDGGNDSDSWLGLEADRQLEDDDLQLLEVVQQEWERDREKIWIGWVTYDLGAKHYHQIPFRKSSIPGIVMRRYRGALQVDASGTPKVHGDADAVPQFAKKQPQGRLSSTPLNPKGIEVNTSLGPWQARMTPEEYRNKVEQAKEYIRDGSCYQINLSQPFHADWDLAAKSISLSKRVSQFYQGLRQRSPASMGSLIRCPSGSWIVSNSPETLLQIQKEKVRSNGGDVDIARSWPIKGTSPRFLDIASDQESARKLLSSEKDLAEHVMIVDLLRNDLSQLARSGSVEAPSKPSLVSLASVHHLVSEVRCELSDGWTLDQVFRSVFPGGSITGAPKRRSMEIIDELEGEARGIYCGAIILLEPNGLRISIPIRTALLEESGATLRSGGGIVADSDPEMERLETLAKVRAFHT